MTCAEHAHWFTVGYHFMAHSRSNGVLRTVILCLVRLVPMGIRIHSERLTLVTTTMVQHRIALCAPPLLAENQTIAQTIFYITESSAKVI